MNAVGDTITVEHRDGSFHVSDDNGAQSIPDGGNPAGYAPSAAIYLGLTALDFRRAYRVLDSTMEPHPSLTFGPRS